MGMMTGMGQGLMGPTPSGQSPFGYNPAGQGGFGGGATPWGNVGMLGGGGMAGGGGMPGGLQGLFALLSAMSGMPSPTPMSTRPPDFGGGLVGGFGGGASPDLFGGGMGGMVIPEPQKSGGGWNAMLPNIAATLMG